MDEESNIYGTVVKRTVMEEDTGCSKDQHCRHDPTTIHHIRKKPAWSSLLILTITCMSLGGSIPVGYISGAGINPYHVEDQWVTLDMVTLRTLLLIGGLFGSLTTLYLTDWAGRRKTIIAASVIGVCGAGFHIIASITQATELLVTAWAILGLSIGVCVSVLPLYLVEVAPLNLRSSLGAVFSFGTMIGALLSQILSLHCALGSCSAHPLLLPVFVIPVFISWFLLPRVPESPLYLYFIKRDDHHAAEELAKLRRVDIRAAENELCQYGSAESGDWSRHQLLKQSTFLFLVCLAQFGQALGRTEQIYHLSTAEARLGEADFVAASYTASVVKCITALVVVHLINIMSWRVLLIFSASVSAILSLIMAATSMLGDYNSDTQYLILATPLIHTVVFDLGLRPIPYFLPCELFDTKASATVMAFGGAANFMGQLISDQLFVYLGLLLFRIFSTLILVLLVILVLFTPTNAPITKRQPSNTAPQRPERRISYLPNPHRVAGI